MNYADKYRHPNWQRRRLEIMDRDGFVCAWCGAKDVMLSVHHKSYKSCEIWDYPDDDLVTLCDTCHQTETEVLNHWKKSAYRFLLDRVEGSVALGNLLSIAELLFSANENKRITAEQSFDVYALVEKHLAGNHEN